MKYFIITIDTEGDNLWTWKEGNPITTENTLYLPRFQSLCEKYGFKPVWLTNYEMINDDRYVDFILSAIKKNNAEIGMHLHAWNTPPDYKLPYVFDGAPYLIEYPDEVMEKKIVTITDLILEKTGIRPVSHRSGRWATNSVYFELLIKHGYLIDTSVTPHINWFKSKGRSNDLGGSDYSQSKEQPYYITSSDSSRKLLEVPVTIRRNNRIWTPEEMKIKPILISVYNAIVGTSVWLRPNGRNLRQMHYLIDRVSNSQKDNYIMFMLHSSELMPGGSPTFKSIEDIENLYLHVESVFEHASKHFKGITLKEYLEVINVN